MKKIIFAVLTILCVTAQAQNAIIIETLPQSNTITSQSSFYVEIPQATTKDVKKDWLNYVGKKSKGRSSENNDIYQQLGVVNKNISPNPFDIQSRFIETPTGVRIVIVLFQNNKSFISEDVTSSSNLAVKKYLYDFAIPQYRTVVKAELEAEKDKQVALEKELTNLNKKEDASIKTISENERFNERANEAIIVNNADIESTTTKISDQKDMVDITSADPNATKGAKKTLSDLESEKVTLQKEGEAYGKHMDDKNKDNRAAERRNINTNQKQEMKLKEIEAQKAKVAEVQNKLNNIK